MNNSKFSVRKLTTISIIAALYAAITFATFFMSFGAVQYRVSEALTVMPAFTAAAIPGLTLGCALANLLGFFIGANPVGLIDALFGTAATLLAAVCTHFLGKSKSRIFRYLLCPLPPVIFNAIIVGFEISYFFVGSTQWPVLLTNGLSVLIGQAVVCYGLGIPLMLVLERKDLAKQLFSFKK